MKMSHGSQSRNVDRLRTQHSRLVNKRVSYATPNWLMALVLGTGWRDDNIRLGVVDGKPYLQEVTSGAFQRFLTRPTFIYTLDEAGWHQPEPLCRFEYVTEHVKPPTNRELIKNPWDIIRNSHIILIPCSYYYPFPL